MTKAKESQKEQESRIERLRAKLKPEKVRLHHLPGWMKKKINLWLRLHDCHSKYSCNALQDFVDATGWNIDHWGSSDNGFVFVNEPYGDGLEKNMEIAKILNLEFCESVNSYWNPGYTRRYEFRIK